jgi:hypothetical protein
MLICSEFVVGLLLGISLNFSRVSDFCVVGGWRVAHRKFGNGGIQTISTSLSVFDAG